MNTDNSVYVAASTFEDKGGWTADPQFMEQMGSSYLIAHGLGQPVDDARTHFTVPQDGTYNLFARTRNWTACWSDRPSPGVFRIRIDDRDTETLFGDGAGEWHWQEGGSIFLTKGTHLLTLHDTTGFDGRCDAILLTATDQRPDDSLEGLFALRGRLMRLPDMPEDKGEFGLVVAGGGVAGMCAAIAAARGGGESRPRTRPEGARRQQLLRGPGRSRRPPEHRQISFAGLPAQRIRARRQRQCTPRRGL